MEESAAAARNGGGTSPLSRNYGFSYDGDGNDDVNESDGMPGAMP